MRARALLAPLLIAGLTACGNVDPALDAGGDGEPAGSTADATTVEGPGEAAATTVEGEAPGGGDAELLAFSAPTIDGAEFAFAALQGGDAVVWFWAPWCGSCAAEADGVARVAAELGDRAPFVGIGSQAELDELAGFVDRFTLTEFPQVADTDGSIWLRFAPDVIRSSFLFIDDTGATERSGYGELDEAQLRQRVQDLIES